jgi:hypothetical protein
MKRLENLVNTIWTIAKAETEGTDLKANNFVKLVALGVEEKLDPADVRAGIADWVQYETELSMRRPDTTHVGPGESMLLRPWAGAAAKLYDTDSYGRNELQPLEQLDPVRNPAPEAVGVGEVGGGSVGSVGPGGEVGSVTRGQADWLFA